MTADLATFPVEFAAPGDRYADYCLWDYAPPQPTTGKLRSATLLWHSFAVAGLPPKAFAIAEALRAGLGSFKTVWGVKQVGGTLAWEFYFYDYARLQRQVSVARVLELLGPHVACALRYPESRPYFMFSLDIDTEVAAGRRGLDHLNIYLGNPGSSISSGIGYTLTADELRLDNFYFFFNARRDLDEIAGKVACSAHVDLPRRNLDEILWPEMLDCETIVVANKKFNDSVYFSRIRVDQLLLFLDRLSYPMAIRANISANRARLDHMLYDIGIDYVTRDGRIAIIKSGYYGIL